MMPKKLSAWPVYTGCVWALLYAVFVRFYQAAGGMIGLPGEIRDPAMLHTASFNAGVAILICGFILLLLANPGSRSLLPRVPWIGNRAVQHFLLLAPTLSCSSFLIAHGIAGIARDALFLAGAISIDVPLFSSVDLRLFSWWDLCVYEMWFLIMGILAGLAAVHYAQSAGISPRVLRAGAAIYWIVSVSFTALFVYGVLQ
jgi:hypothetical protein